MSARVFKPIPLTEMHKIRSSPTVDGNCCTYKGVQKVRRSLFNIPDPEETKRFLKEEFAKLATANRDRWDFDFIAGAPSTTGRYEWTVVTEKPKSGNPTRPMKQFVFAHEDLDDDLYAPIASSSVVALEEEMDEMLTDTADAHDKELPKKQSLITDFMQARKRIEETSIKKKIDTSNTSRPKKMARMSLADSAS